MSHNVLEGAISSNSSLRFALIEVKYKALICMLVVDDSK